MHQVVIHIIGPQAAQLLLEEFLQTRPAFDEIMGQFGGDVNILADIVFLQDLAQRRFTAAVDIGGVEIIDALTDRGHNLLFRCRHIDPVAVFLKTQAAEAQDGQGRAVFIHSVVHWITLPFSSYVITSAGLAQEKSGLPQNEDGCIFLFLAVSVILS